MRYDPDGILSKNDFVGTIEEYTMERGRFLPRSIFIFISILFLFVSLSLFPVQRHHRSVLELIV